MSASSLPAAPAPLSSLEHPPRVSTTKFWLWLAVGIVSTWVLFLAVMTFRMASPAVVNAVQIVESDLILVGRWDRDSENRFDVERELKHGQLRGPVNVLGLPEKGMPTGEAWVIPVTKIGDAYSVTQGTFPLRRQPDAPPDAKLPFQRVDVSPQCYPVTDDVLRQIERILAAP